MSNEPLTGAFVYWLIFKPAAWGRHSGSIFERSIHVSPFLNCLCMTAWERGQCPADCKNLCCQLYHVRSIDTHIVVKWAHLPEMLTATRKSDGQIVTAYLERKSNGPFRCLECGDEVVLKTGRSRVNHFAHTNPIACKFQQGESELHRRCKMEIYEALRRERNVSETALERPFGLVRPDVSARINGIPVAIEVQISSLSLETIQQRTIEYARLGIYVLWLLQWTPALDAKRYSPRRWEKWIHTTYFGRVYYWMGGLGVASYHFDPYFKAVPKMSWYSRNGEKQTGGGYSARSRRYRTAVRGNTLNLAKDFVAKNRDWWEGGGLKIPGAKLFIQETQLPFATS